MRNKAEECTSPHCLISILFIYFHKIKAILQGEERLKTKIDLLSLPVLGLDLALSLRRHLKGLLGGSLSRFSNRRS
jgi:hypothetical protein